jgi:hypothetical protein
VKEHLIRLRSKDGAIRVYHPSFTPAGLKVLAKIKSLMLPSCPKITDDGLQELAAVKGLIAVPGQGPASRSHVLETPQHFLNFLPLPQGQGSLRPTRTAGPARVAGCLIDGGTDFGGAPPLLAGGRGAVGAGRAGGGFNFSISFLTDLASAGRPVSE